jgi:predicted DNA-binding ribbon-helix-helix protein
MGTGLTTVSISEALYARLQGIAEQRGCTVAELVERWAQTLVQLPEMDRDLVFRVVRLLIRRGEPEADKWIEVIEVSADRAVTP